MNQINQKIKDLVEKHPGQMTENEYVTISRALGDKSPCKLLVFGLGHDSAIWAEINKNGLTVFLNTTKNG